MGDSRFYHISKEGKMDLVTTIAKAMERTKEGGFFWLYFLEPKTEDLHPLIDLLGLHTLSVEDALDQNQIPKIDDFADNTFVLFNTFSYSNKQLTVKEIDFFLGKNFLISVDRLGPDGKPLLDGIEEFVLREMDVNRFGPAFVMHTILDIIVDRKFIAIEAIEDALTEIEESMMDRSKKFNPRSLQHIRRALLTLRKSLFHEREVFVKICRKDCPLIPDKAIFHYRDVYDHLTRFFELTETLRDVATSLMEIDLSLRSNEMSSAANRTNRSVRRLTLITTIFMSLSLFAGIGGMSEWSMMTGPENWRISYPIFILVMTIGGITSYYLLKWMVKHDDEKAMSDEDYNE